MLTIMVVTGHKTEKLFLKYTKFHRTEEAERMKQHWKKFLGNVFRLPGTVIFLNFKV